MDGWSEAGGAGRGRGPPLVGPGLGDGGKILASRRIGDGALKSSRDLLRVYCTVPTLPTCSLQGYRHSANNPTTNLTNTGT